MLRWLQSLFNPPKPVGPPETIRRFDGSEMTITEDVVCSSEGGWLIDTDEGQTVRLFELAMTDIDSCMLTYRASMKSENIQGRGFLEMWCRLPGRGEFFSKGFQTALKGTNDWATYEVPFYLKSGQTPDLVKLNVTLEGSGRLWIKDIELSYTKLA